MKITKKVLDEMERCYAASSLVVDGELYIVLASEAIDGPCYAYTGEDFSKKEVIWEKAGGTMSLIQIPNTNGEFLAVQRFFPGFQSAEAKIVWGKRDPEKGWIVKDLIDIPYVHRFDIFEIDGANYFLAATLCGSKKDREDWSDPGKVYIGKLPDSPEKGMELKPILENLTKNHGYCRAKYQGRAAGYVTSDEGIFVVVPPEKEDQEWSVHHIMDRPVGDVALCDLDGDGEDELITIEPFHGDQFLVNKKIDGKYETVYSYPNEIQFAHAVVGCTLRGKPSVVGGIRRKDSELFIIQCTDSAEQKYESTVLEKEIGPSNVAVINQKDRDIIIAANHTQNQAALYFVE